MLGIEKASLLKRFSAYILDSIIVIIIATGAIYALSGIFNYNEYYNKLEGFYDKWEKDYNISFNLTMEEYEALTESERNRYQEVYDNFSKDKEVIATYNKVVNLSLSMTTMGILLAVMISEFIVPQFFKNGKTLGKKIFGICLVKNNGVKINNLMLFIRTLLGKYTIETMIPVYIIILMIFSNAGIGVILLPLILILQICLILFTRQKTAIHDLMAATVVVDEASQMIFESEEELIKFKEEKAKEEAINKKY